MFLQLMNHTMLPLQVAILGKERRTKSVYTEKTAKYVDPDYKFDTFWVEVARVYTTREALDEKIDELCARFLRNRVNYVEPHDITDVIDSRILELSGQIWGPKKPELSRGQKDANDLNLLKEMEKFRSEHGSYPFADSGNNLQHFYQDLVKGGTHVYRDIMDLNHKMEELSTRFEMLMVKKDTGEDVTSSMNETQTRILERMITIWGRKDVDHKSKQDTGKSVGPNGSSEQQARSDSSSKGNQ